MIRWDVLDPGSMTDKELVDEYASEAEAEDPRLTALAAEIERRGIDL